mmetsp:Transcript_31884/g.28233  ORF Transcript_31884/g.28233 Transcript_31884/m.28233 type:complete len:137 (+) Transcript_31884:525-935(+)
MVFFSSNIMFLISEIILIILLLRAIEKNLAEFHTMHSKDFKLLAVINTIYYAFQTFLFILLLLQEKSFIEITKISKLEDNKKLLWTLVLFLNQMLPLVYAFFNIKNVQFKMYIFKMLVGKSAKIKLEDSSLFIILS